MMMTISSYESINNKRNLTKIVKAKKKLTKRAVAAYFHSE